MMSSLRSRFHRVRKKCFFSSILIFLLLFTLLSLYGIDFKFNHLKTKLFLPPIPSNNIKTKINGTSASHEEKIASVLSNKEKKRAVDSNQNKLNFKAHVFYYAWYGTPKFDGQWWHWNHEYIPPWDKNDLKIYPTGHHVPEKRDIGANFYPTLGPYNSKDPAVINSHLAMMSNASIGVIAVSWYPPGQADENGPPSDNIIPLLLDAALDFGLKICLHIEPYSDRGVENLREHLKYVQTTYGSHPAYYKVRSGTRSLPLFYIYDSYRTTPSDWNRLFGTKGDLSIRKTELDGIFIGLLVEYKHRFDIKSAGFDGFYTYFASNSFTYGSSWKNWKGLASFAFKNSLLFVPSVGPGYVDTRVRAWNSKTTQSRKGGSYYETAWRTALGAPARYISITSFNEWHEGTQIEPAEETECEGFKYENYGSRGPNLYLELTNKWNKIMINSSSTIGRLKTR